MTPEDYDRTKRALLDVARRVDGMKLDAFLNVAARAEQLSMHADPGGRQGTRSAALRELAGEARGLQWVIRSRGLLTPFARPVRGARRGA